MEYHHLGKTLTFHSSRDSGYSLNKEARKGTYSTSMCRNVGTATPSRSHGLRQGGIAKREDSNEMAESALSISITTRADRAMDWGRDFRSVNMEQGD